VVRDVPKTWREAPSEPRKRNEREQGMFSLKKTSAAKYANLSPLDRFGFVPAADPINCVAENCAVAEFLAVALTEKAADVGNAPIAQDVAEDAAGAAGAAQVAEAAQRATAAAGAGVGVGG
jgi:hypothetical protein